MPTRPSRDSSTAIIRGWLLSRAAAARVVLGAAGNLMTQPVTAAPIATASKAAAVSGTNTANGLPGSANGAVRICGSRPAAARSAAAEFTTSRTVSRTSSASTPSSISTTNRPKAPSTWALATPGILRTGSSTTAACSCQRGNGSSGSRSRCTRCPLCQRTVAEAPSRLPLAGRPVPSRRAVDWLTESSTGPVSVCTASAAVVAPCTPACNICTAPPATPPTKAVTPGTFITHPSQRLRCRSAPPRHSDGLGCTTKWGESGHPR